ncbi:MAG: hypothetical protein JXR83_12995 [Deltaproteobacteria bacterium]|nr:hypothetical protein [Deltaproteobacteria bacterium]
MSLRDQMSKTVGQLGRLVRSLAGATRPVAEFGVVPFAYVERPGSEIARLSLPAQPAVAKILESTPLERAMRAIGERSLQSPLAYVSAEHVGWLSNLAALAMLYGKPVEFLIAMDAAVGGFAAKLNAEGRANLVAIVAHAQAAQLRRGR